MTNVVYLIFFGLLGGILGGMGMGGGTFLIPLLTIFAGINQTIAQGYNLISFLFMSIFALIIHAKNNLIEKKVILKIVLPAIVFSVCGALLANFVDKIVLKILFGVFLCLLSSYEFYKFFAD